MCQNVSGDDIIEQTNKRERMKVYFREANERKKKRERDLKTQGSYEYTAWRRPRVLQLLSMQ